jgi:hypothetical protein
VLIIVAMLLFVMAKFVMQRIEAVSRASFKSFARAADINTTIAITVH